MDPQKARFWFLKKNHIKMFFMFWLWFSFKKNRRTNVLLVGIFVKALKKLLAITNAILAVFWQLLTFFSAFLKILTKTTFVSLLFLKLKQKKIWKKYVFKVLFQYSLTCFLGGQLIFVWNFFSVLALTSVDTQMLFWSIFFLMH